MASKKIWITVISVIGLILVGIVLYRSTLQPAGMTVNSGIPTAEPDELIGIGLKIPGSERGSYWDLEVDRMERTQQKARLTRITGKYYIKREPIYQISADFGEFNWRTRVLGVSGHVVFKTRDGKELSAAAVVWNPLKSQLSAKGNVHLKTADVILTTESLEAGLDLQQAVFSGMTKVTYRR